MGLTAQGGQFEGGHWGTADEDKYVHYGDFVAFSGATIGGFLGADSVLSDTLFFEQVDVPREHDIPDAQDAVFTVLPKFMYSAAKAAKKAMRERDGGPIRGAEQDELDAALRAMEDEKDTNEMELRRRSGKPVEYGSVVQLQHSLSRKYVTQLKNRAEVDTLAMEIGLRQEGEEASWWRIRSKETTRRNGEAVRWDDAVIFENVKFSHSYLALTRGAAEETWGSGRGGGRAEKGSWAISVLGPVQKQWEVKVAACDCEKGRDWKVVTVDTTRGQEEASRSKYAHREEVCAGAQPFRFRVVPFLPLNEQDVTIAKAALEDHYTQYNSLPHRLVHGGAVLTMEHRKTGYLLHGKPNGVVQWVHRKYREMAASMGQGAYDSQHEPSRLHTTTETDRVEPGCYWRVIGANVRMGGLSIGFGGVLIQHLVSGKYLGVDEFGRPGLRDTLDGEANHWEVITQMAGDNGDPCSAGQVRGGETAWLRTLGASKSAQNGNQLNSISSAGGGPGSGVRGSAFNGSLKNLLMSSRQNSMKRGASSSQLLPPNSASSPQHAASTWLGCDTPDCVQWAVTNVYSALVQPSHFAINDDVLELQLVNMEEASIVDAMRHRHELLSAVNRSLGSIPPVPEDIDDEDKVDYITRNSSKVLTPQLIRLLESNMKKMIAACRDDQDHSDVFKLSGSPVPEVQDLLLSTGVLTLAIEIVQTVTKKVLVPAALIKPRLPNLFSICRMCYLLVEQACKGNIRCKKAMFPYFKMMQQQATAMIGSYYAMMETAVGYREVLIGLDEERLVNGVGYLRKLGNSKLLHFLIEACRCGDEPLRRNQNIITEQLFVQHSEMLFLTEFDGDDVVITRPGVEGAVELRVARVLDRYTRDLDTRDLLSDPLLMMHDTEDKELKAYQYYLYMLHLFAALLAGRNQVAHAALLKESGRMGFGYEQLLRLMGNKRLPNSLRKAACALVIQLYVDCEPHEYVKPMIKTRVWGGLWPRLNAGEAANQVQIPACGAATAVRKANSAASGGLRALRNTVSLRSTATAATGSSSPIRRDAFHSSNWNPSDEEDDLEDGFGISRDVSSQLHHHDTASRRARRPSVEEVLEKLQEGQEESKRDLCQLSLQEIKTRANGDKLPELKALLVQLLLENTETDCDNQGRNHLVAAVVDVVRALMKFGFYHIPDPACHQELQCDFEQVKPLVEAMVRVADGRADTCNPEQFYRRSSGLVHLSRIASNPESTDGGRVGSLQRGHKGSLGGNSSSSQQSFGRTRLRKGASSSAMSGGAAEAEAETARYKPYPRNMIVFLTKRRVLEYIMDALNALEDHRLSTFIRAWEALLNKKLDFALESSAYASKAPQQENSGLSNGRARPEAPVSSNGSNGNGNGHGNGSSRSMARRDSKNHAGSVGSGAARSQASAVASIMRGGGGAQMSRRNARANGGSAPTAGQAYLEEKLDFTRQLSEGWLAAYVEDKELWERAPPWSEEELGSLCAALFERPPLISDVAESADLQRMFEKQNGEMLPPWVCILLDLVRYSCPYLKQQAIAHLVRAFNVEASFVTSALATHILYCPTVAVDYLRAVEGKQNMLKAQRLFNSQDAGERRMALEKVTDLYREWGRLTQLTEERRWIQVKEWQHVMSSMGVIDFALYLLAMPVDRVYELEPGKQDRCRDPLLAQLLNAIYFFLYWQCMDNAPVQKKLLGHAELIKSHLGLEVVDADKLLGAICKNNMEIVEKVGKEWIRMLFFDLVNRYKCARIEWLQILHYLMKCKGRPLKSNQALVMTYFQQCEGILASFFTSDADHDRRIRLMQKVHHAECDRVCGRQEDSVLGYHLAVVRLLALCSEGKNPAAEVYAAHFVSLSSTMKALCALTRQRETGEEEEVPRAVYYRVKATFVYLLLHVFVDTKVRRLIDELEREGNGLWTCEEDGIRGCTPVMEQMAEELRMVADGPEAAFRRVGGTQAEFDVWWDALLLYKRQSVVPLLKFYYGLHYKKEKAPADEAVTERIFSALNDIYGKESLRLAEEGDEAALHSCCMTAHQANEQVRALIKIMTDKCHMKQQVALASSKSAGSGSRHTQTIEEESAKIMQTIQFGYKSMIGAIAKRYGADTSCDAGGMGVRKAALLLCRQGEARLYECPELYSGLRRPPSTPEYESLGRAILDVSHFKDTNPVVVCNILQIMAASVYILDPADPVRTPKECEDEWKRMKAYAPAVKSGPRGEETLEWVQNKYDAMGCTVAALRLLRHQDVWVQKKASTLLLALLQRGNRRVQRSVVRHIATTQDRGLLTCVSSMLEAALENLSDLKRKTKQAKSAGQIVADEEQVEGNIELYGRDSRLMLTLRLVQLLCEGQFRGLQDLMREPDEQGRTVMGRMVDLLEAIPPLLPDALTFRDGSLYILAMQIADALSEAVQGPNYQSQDFLMGGNFLVVANRMFSMLHYVPFDGDHCRARTIDVYMNDCICWLKLSLLRCCAALLEGCVDGRQAETMMQFVELRNIQAQLLESGMLLGFVARPDGSSGNSSIMDSGTGSTTSTMMLGNRRKHCPRRAWERCQKEAISGFCFSEGKQQSLEEEMFTCWFMLLSLAEFDKSGAVHETLQQIHIEHPKLERHLQEATCDVELVRARRDKRGDKVVERVFFRVSDKVRDLVLHGAHFREKATEKMFDVPRENPQEKARLFVGKLRLVHTRVKFYVVLLGCSFREFVILNQNIFDCAPRILSVIITLLLLMFYGIPYDPNTGGILGDGRFYSAEDEVPAGYRDDMYAFANQTSDPTGNGAFYSTVVAATDPSLKFRLRLQSRWDSLDEWKWFPEGRLVLWALVVLHVLLTLINTAIYIMFELPLVISEVVDEHEKYLMEKDKRERGRHGRAGALEDGVGEEEFGVNEALNQIEADESLLVREADVGSAPMQPVCREGQRFFWQVFKRMHVPCYLAVMCMISLLGALSSPFFIVCYMLDYFRTKDGRMVVQAVILGGPNLFRSFAVGMIVIVCFGFYSYAYFSDSVNHEQEVCRSPFQCVTKHILDSMTGDLTTVVGDDFGNYAFPALVFWSDSWHSWRTWFLFVSIIFWVFLLQGIIQGQIIDAFAEKRLAAEAKQKDLESKCFVTSIDRFVFTGYPGEWEKRRSGQYAWHYLLFLAYLEEKDSEEYSGLENEVARALKRDSVAFLPVEAFVAQQREQVRLGTKENLEAKVEGFTGRLQRIEGALERLSMGSHAIAQHVHGMTDQVVSIGNSSHHASSRVAPDSAAVVHASPLAGERPGHSMVMTPAHLMGTLTREGGADQAGLMDPPDDDAPIVSLASPR